MNTEKSERAIVKNEKVLNAVYIGTLCSVAYLAVYFARNILGAVTPLMIEEGYSESYIGKVSSVYFIFYAVGQLINGSIGDKIKARNMIATGLFMSGVMNFLFSRISGTSQEAALVIYGLTGFFLAMIYGPMTKVVAENTEPVYATRCSLGYTIASFLGSPLAGASAVFFAWRRVFDLSSIVLVVMAVIAFLIFKIFEKKGIVQYNLYAHKKKEQGNIKTLIKHSIIKFTVISVLTGVIRTTVVFWMPTYISQYLGFSSEKAAMIFTVATFVICFTAFIVIFIYERLGRNMNLTILIMFSSASVFFALVYFTKHPLLNIIFLILAIMSSNGAACMLWSRYCPSLRDTGMVSTATGFLDFMSYMSAAASSTLFANAVTEIGWGRLILIWLVLMLVGVAVSISYKK